MNGQQWKQSGTDGFEGGFVAGRSSFDPALPRVAIYFSDAAVTVIAPRMVRPIMVSTTFRECVAHPSY